MGDVVVSRATAKDWRTVRSVRLCALTSDPGAFGSSLARERGFDDDVWRARAAAGQTFLASSGERAVGIVTLRVEGGRERERQLTSMWVAPEARGDGVGSRLVQVARDAAALEGALVLTLFVADGNDRARRFYERLGFLATGERETLPSNPCLGEERYAIGLPCAGRRDVGQA